MSGKCELSSVAAGVEPDWVGPRGLPLTKSSLQFRIQIKHQSIYWVSVKALTIVQRNWLKWLGFLIYHRFIDRDLLKEKFVSFSILSRFAGFCAFIVMSGKTVLVTGASGYIGSHCIVTLLEGENIIFVHIQFITTFFVKRAMMWLHWITSPIPCMD